MDTRVRHNGSSVAVIGRPEKAPRRARNIYEVVAGALLSITGIGMILSIITNEALYPAARHYSTFANTISDLGGTVRARTSRMAERASRRNSSSTT